MPTRIEHNGQVALEPIPRGDTTFVLEGNPLEPNPGPLTLRVEHADAVVARLTIQNPGHLIIEGEPWIEEPEQITQPLHPKT